MKGFFTMVATISIGVIAGALADYWMVNVYMKYALMAVVITASLRVLS